MRSWLRTRLLLLLIAAGAAAAVTWVLPAWAVQPSRARLQGSASAAETARWAASHHAESGCCYTLNAVWCTAAVWLAAYAARGITERGPEPTSSSRRT